MLFRSDGLVWFGLVWFGLVWFGLVWIGLDSCVLILFFMFPPHVCLVGFVFFGFSVFSNSKVA